MALNRRQIENDIKNCVNGIKSVEGKFSALLRHTKGLTCYDDLVKQGKTLSGIKSMLGDVELIDKKTKEPLK